MSCFNRHKGVLVVVLCTASIRFALAQTPRAAGMLGFLALNAPKEPGEDIALSADGALVETSSSSRLVTSG